MTTNATDISNPLENLSPVDQKEVARLDAAHVLGMRRLRAKETRGEATRALVHAEAQARLDLAAAIIAMDDKDELIAAGQPLHSLNEQAAVEIAQHKYTSALADLVRGYAVSNEER